MPQASAAKVPSCGTDTPPERPILYGPVQSRRLGFSLGVDLLPSVQKACTFDCLYCESGWTPWNDAQRSWFPSIHDLKEALSRELPALARRHPSIEAITFSGQGEPTLFPEFSAAVSLVREWGQRYLPWARLVILTNGSTLGRQGLFDAIRRFDVRCVKLDAGTVWMNRPRSGFDLQKLLRVWSEIPNVTLQSFFSQGRFDNTAREWVDPWIEQVKTIRPRVVHLYTLDRKPPAKGMEKASLSTLTQIGRRLASEASVQVRVFE